MESVGLFTLYYGEGSPDIRFSVLSIIINICIEDEVAVKLSYEAGGSNVLLTWWWLPLTLTLWLHCTSLTWWHGRSALGPGTNTAWYLHIPASRQPSQSPNSQIIRQLVIIIVRGNIQKWGTCSNNVNRTVKLFQNFYFYFASICSDLFEFSSHMTSLDH